jgi:hypothetical protein
MSDSSLWREAVRDLGAITDVPHWEKYDLINRAIKTVIGQFYDLVSNLYMTEATIAGTSGFYETGSTGTYTVSTKTLALQTPSRNIISTDVGKQVSFRIGTSTYSAIIESVATTSSFVVTGIGLPASNGTLASVIVVGDLPTANKLSLSDLRVMMAGQQIKLQLASSTSGVTIKSATMSEIDNFRTGGVNRKTVLWAINGDNVEIAYGDDVDLGTLTLRYPRVPELVSSTATGIDLPDGTIMEIAILYLKGLIQQRITGHKDNNEAKLSDLINNLYTTFGQEANAEINKEKVLALK